MATGTRTSDSVMIFRCNAARVKFQYSAAATSAKIGTNTIEAAARTYSRSKNVVPALKIHFSTSMRAGHGVALHRFCTAIMREPRTISTAHGANAIAVNPRAHMNARRRTPRKRHAAYIACETSTPANSVSVYMPAVAQNAYATHHPGLLERAARSSTAVESAIIAAHKPYSRACCE